MNTNADPACQAGLHEQLARWVADGLIDHEQAARIEAAGEFPPATGPPPAGRDRRAPLVIEALGYAGSVLALAGGLFTVHQLWPRIPLSAALTLAAATAVALGIAGALIPADGQPSLGRLRNALWVMSAAALAGFTAALTSQVTHLSGLGALTATAAAAGTYAMVLWLRARSAPLLLAGLGAVAVTAGAATALLASGSGAWGPGIAVCLTAALWAAGADRGYLTPRRTALVAAGGGLLIGLQLIMDVRPGVAFAFIVVVAALAGGVALRRTWLLACGMAGAIEVVPQAAAQYLPQTAAATVSVCLTGVILVCAAIWFARHPARKRPPRGSR